MTKPIPPPWSVEIHNDQQDVVIVGPGLTGTIATISATFGPYREEALATAYQMAASPELLEALKGLSDGTTANWTAKLAAARLAIAKAENR